MWIDDKHEINDCESLGAPIDISSVRINAGHFYRGKWPFYREKLCLVCVTGLSRGRFPVLIIHGYLK